MKSFVQYISENIDTTAGVEYGDSKYKFRVRDLIKHTQSSRLANLSLRHFKGIETQTAGSESPETASRRISGADLEHPIIVLRHHVPNTPRHLYQVLDGTHRVRKALAAGMTKLPARIVDPGHMTPFKQKITEAGIMRKWRVLDSATRSAHHTFRTLKPGEVGPSLHQKKAVTQLMRNLRAAVDTEIDKRAPRIKQRAAAEAERVLGPVNPYGGISQQLDHEGDLQRLTHMYRREMEIPTEPPSFVTGKPSRFKHLLDPRSEVYKV